MTEMSQLQFLLQLCLNNTTLFNILGILQINRIFSTEWAMRKDKIKLIGGLACGNVCYQGPLQSVTLTTSDLDPFFKLS